jgi:hypothetical protein
MNTGPIYFRRPKSSERRSLCFAPTLQRKSVGNPNTTMNIPAAEPIIVSSGLSSSHGDRHSITGIFMGKSALSPEKGGYDENNGVKQSLRKHPRDSRASVSRWMGFPENPFLMSMRLVARIMATAEKFA